ncbi:MAG: ABC transporter permease subunit [Bacteroidales bacterium]|nr:ABC transporter permease subunit [Bacteroidales bacterium]
MYKQIYIKLKSICKNTILAIPTIFIITIVGIAPLIQALYTSFFSDIYSEKVFVAFENYKFILSEKGFIYSFNISSIWAMLNIIFSILIGLIISYKLVNKNNKLLLIAICIPFAIPIYISVPIWRLFFHGDSGISLFYKLTNINVNLLINPVKTFIVSLFVNCWLTIPTNVIFFSSSIRKIPKEIILSAKMDGANNFQILTKIIIPIIKNTTITLVVLNSIKFIKDFNVPYMLSMGGPPLLKGITDHFIIGATTTLDILIYDIFTTTSNYGLSSAYSILFIIIIVFLMILLAITKSDKKQIVLSFFLISISQIIINKKFSIIFILIYGISLFLYKKNNQEKAQFMFLFGLFLEIIYFILNILYKGILEGFDFGLFIAFIIFITQIKKIKNISIKKSKQKFYHLIQKSYLPNIIINNLFNILTKLIMFLIITSSFLIIYLLIKLSFSEIGSIYIDSIIPKFDTLENYKNIIIKENFFKYIKNSLFLSISTSAIIPFIIMPTAFWLKQKTDKTIYSFLTFIQIIGIYGGMHSLIPLFILFSKINATQTYLPLILIYLNHAIPIGLFTTLAFIDKFPKSLKEVSIIEGTSKIQYLRFILFPLCIPVIFSNILLTFLSSWNGFIAPLLFLNQDNKFTISVKLYSLIGNLSSGFPHWNIFAAGAIINCLIIIVIIIMIERFSENSFLADFLD